MLYVRNSERGVHTENRKREKQRGNQRECGGLRKRGYRQDTNSRVREKHSSNTSFLYLTTRLRVAAVGCLGEFGVRARCCGAYHTVPVGWPGVDVLQLSFPPLLVLLLLLSFGPLLGSWQSSSARPDMCLRSVCPLVVVVAGVMVCLRSLLRGFC